MAAKKTLEMIKLTPHIRDSMLKEVHDVIHHNGLITKIEGLIDSFEEYKKGKEEQEIEELKKMIKVQAERKSERNRFWFWVIGFFLGNEIVWQYAIPFLEKWIGKLVAGE